MSIRGFIPAATLGAVLTGLTVWLAFGGADVYGEPVRPAHHTNDGFVNLYAEHSERGFFSFVRLRLLGGEDWADQSAGADEVPVQALDPALLQGAQPQPRLSWLGHSTFLVQYRDLTVLTDPIFSDRASPFRGLGPKRYIPHVIDYDALPNIDIVVISHNHYDHLDKATIRRLGDQPLYLVPLGIKAWIQEQGIDPARVIELDWWDQHAAGDAFVQAMPSQHWSARWLNDRYQTLWASWYVRIGDFDFWFAGDTGYNPYQFVEIGARTGGVDLALIPIGAYAPRSFMKKHHLNGAEAVQVHRDIRARFSVGMHWGTFPLTAEPTLEPLVKLAEARTAAGIGADVFTTMAVGESFVLAHDPASGWGRL